MKNITSIWTSKDSTLMKLWGYEKEKDPYEVAPVSELKNWNYTLNDTDNTITLNYYTSSSDSSKDVIVYDNYVVNEKKYKTKISNNNGDTTKYLFQSVSGIYSVTFGNNVNFSDITNMSYMFYGCINLLNINFGNNFDTSNVTDMSNMFARCNRLNDLNLSNFNTSNVTNMKNMFFECWYNLTTLDLSNFDISNVINMECMFYKCQQLQCIYVSEDKWIISPSCNTSGMYTGCLTSSVTYK